MPQLWQSRLYTAQPSWWKRVECDRVLTFLIPPILTNYSNSIVDKHPAATAVWEPQDGSSWSPGARPLLSGVFRFVNRYGFGSSAIDAFLIPLLLLWNNFAKQKWIFHLLPVCTVDFHTASPEAV